MAKSIVINQAGTRQSKKSEITFRLNLTEAQWRLFWRLLTVGCGMSDDLIDAIEGQETHVTAARAHLWQKLSQEFAAAVEDGEIERFKKVMDEDSSC